jgi:retron-type reverse transcriptase
MLRTTKAGTPQCRIASPTLAMMALTGLEALAMAAAPRQAKVNVVAYADDFIITRASKEVLARVTRYEAPVSSATNTSSHDVGSPR